MLAISLRTGAALYESNFRPVPLDEFIKCERKIYRHVGNGVTQHVGDLPEAHAADKDHVVALCIETLSEGNSVLVFVSSKKGCVSTAQMISKVLPQVAPALNSDVELKQRRLELVDTLKRTPGGLCPTLEATVPMGVAYHNAGLTVEERDAIEQVKISPFFHCFCRDLLSRFFPARHCFSTILTSNSWPA